MEKEMNAGYEIIEKLTVGENHFVLGKSDGAYGTKYATWCSRTEDPTNFFWGHYLENYHDAQEDLYARALEQAQMNNPLHRQRMLEKLPDFCMSTLPSSGDLIKITHKEKGYKDANIFTDSPAENKMIAKYINNLLGVDKAQEAAMVAGSMFGWNVPAANPANYDADGKPIKPKHKEMER